MNKTDAKKIAKQHKFTKIELHEMMVEALDSYSDDYWKKPNYVNPIFDNGYFFNSCRKWLDYQKNVNDDKICEEMVTYRVLQCAGKFSKIKIPKKIKPKIEIKVSEKPKL